MIDWNPENQEILRVFWNQGLTTQKIATIMGTSKNSIIGKANRLGLPSRARGNKLGKKYPSVSPSSSVSVAKISGGMRRRQIKKTPYDYGILTSSHDGCYFLSC